MQLLNPFCRETPVVMHDHEPGLLGTLIDVSGERFIARIGERGDDYAPYRQLGVERIAVGQVGAYVIARGAQEQVLCQVIRVWEEPIAGEMSHQMRLLPLGEVTSDGQFFRGVGRYPHSGHRSTSRKAASSMPCSTPCAVSAFTWAA